MIPSLGGYGSANPGGLVAGGRRRTGAYDSEHALPQPTGDADTQCPEHPDIARIRVLPVCHVVEGDLGEMPLYVVCEHIAQDQIGHTCGGKRFLCTQHNNVDVPDAPHTGYALRGDGVIIIQLGSHRQWVSPVFMVNSALLRWTLSPV